MGGYGQFGEDMDQYAIYFMGIDDNKICRLRGLERAYMPNLKTINASIIYDKTG